MRRNAHGNIGGWSFVVLPVVVENKGCWRKAAAAAFVDDVNADGGT
jgi:hypothetical protein